MKEKTFVDFYTKHYHKGSFVQLVKETNDNGYVKETTMVVMLVNYYNTKEAKQANRQPSAPKAYENTIIPHILKTNTNTGNTLVMVHTTEKHKSHSKYWLNGQPITKDQYYVGTGKKPSAPTHTMSIRLSTIKSIGGYKD